MRKIRTKTGIIFTLLVCTALVLSGCGSKTTESAGDEVSGRVSAFSDSEITVEVFQRNSDNSDGRPERTDAASGGAVGNGGKSSGQMPKGESKTYTITEDTKFYENDGDSTTEISLNDLELGGDVALVLDSEGKNVVSVTKQQRQRENMPPNGKNGNDTENDNQSSK